MCLLISASGFAAEKNMDNEIGFGITFSNEMYKMEKKSKGISFFPTGTFSYKNFYLSDSEAGINIMPNENLVFSAFADFRDGYSVKGEKLEDGYKTFRDRKWQVAFGGKIGYVSGNLESYVSGKKGRRGSTGELGINYVIPINERFSVLSGINYTLYSKKFTDYYFGVHKQDMGGKLKKEYRPERGSSFGLHLGAEYRITGNFSTFAMLSTEKFSKEIYNSPVIKNKTSVIGGLGIKYNF